MKKELGQITSVRFGQGGYQDAMLGISFGLGGQGWGCGDFWGAWKTWREGNKWSIQDQAAVFADTVTRIGKLLDSAKKQSIDQLVGVPVEVVFENNRLKSWRILTEVI